MKKGLLTVGGIFASAALYAMPVLNLAEPALLTNSTILKDRGHCWGVKIGYRGDFVANRRFEDSEFGTVSKFSFYSNSVVLTFNLWDRLDLYGFVGPSSYVYENAGQINNQSPGVAVQARLESPTNTLWGLGGKLVLWEACWADYGTTYIGIDGQYEYSVRRAAQSVYIDDVPVADNNVGYGFREWQVALGVSHRIWNLVPYLAIKYSQARAKVIGSNVGTTGTNTANFHNLRTYQNLGWAFGTTFVDANRMSVTAEARFKDETAFSVAAEFRF